MKQALLTSCDRAFLPGAEGLMRSARTFHADIPRFCMVPTEDMVEARQRLGDLAEVLPFPRLLVGVPDRMQCAAGRVFLVSIRADVVAYVDADACFVSPAPELWQVSRGRVHAIHDMAPVVLNNLPAAFKGVFRDNFPGTSTAKGFNSGVLALRPAEWQDLPDKFEAALARCAYPSYPGVLDQPLLNTILLPAVNWLPFKFNVTVLSDNRIPGDARIIHFTGKEKPWMAGFPKHEPAYYYWVKFALGETSPEQLRGIRIRILLRTPRRIVVRWIKRFLRDLVRARGVTIL